MDEAERCGGVSPDGGGGGYSAGTNMFLREVRKETMGSEVLAAGVRVGSGVVSDDDSAAGGGEGSERRALRTEVKIERAVGRLPCLAWWTARAVETRRMFSDGRGMILFFKTPVRRSMT